MKDKLLLHTCCADCLLKALEKLNDYDVDIFYSNPNIHPRSEYLARLEALKLSLKTNDYENKLIVTDWQPKLYLSEMKKIDPLKEVSKRCTLCWSLRLKLLFDYAHKNNYKFVSTTLLSSKYQNIDVITRIANAHEKLMNIKFVKYSMDEESQNKKYYGFYKQNYCGCVYSLLEKYEEKRNAINS